MDIAIFSKAPQAGQSKTRLIPALGPGGAARLQRRMTLGILQLAVQFSPGNTTLWCAPDYHHRFFRALSKRCRISFRSQYGKDIGERMHHAFATHSTPLLLVGSDCPALTLNHFEAAASALREGADAVFIPAEDGGYVLVGLRQPQLRLFEDIDWGSGQVMHQTRERLVELGLRWAELETLWDVDRPEDLARLEASEKWM
ncbi:MAG: TIGR04282 family arsenosugar biosynthesis glycosyltransferase [Betaproteobacteria bacterium]